MTTPVLQLRAVGRTHGSGGGQVVALAAVDLEVLAGEVVSVMGPSGSGKTTLLALAGGLDAATTGDVLVEGALLTSMQRPASARGSRRAGTSRRTGHRHLALLDDGGRVLEGGSHVLTLEVGMVLEHLLAGSTRSELTEHHAHGDPQAPDAGDPTHLRRVDGDPLEGHPP